MRWCGWLSPGLVIPSPPEGFDWDVVLGSLEPEHVRSRVDCEPTSKPATASWDLAPIVTHSASGTETNKTANPGRIPAPLEFPAEFDDVYHLPGTNGDLTRPQAWVRIPARPWLCGQWVRVVIDKQLSLGEVDADLGRAIIAELEGRISVAAEAAWGPRLPWQRGTPLTVLLTPWVARSSQSSGDDQGTLSAGSGNGAASGLFRPDDLRRDLAATMSCGRPVIYLDSGLKPGARLGAVLTHEFTHYFVCASKLRATGDVRQEDWLNEGLAHFGETRLGAGGSNLEPRLAAFRAASSNSPLVVANAAVSGRWRDPGCRGAAYLFTQWCAERYGDRFVPDLAAEPQSGADGVAQLMGRPFEQLFVEWGAHLAAEETLESVDPSRPVTLSGTAFARVRLPGNETRHWRIALRETRNSENERVFVLARAQRRVGNNNSSGRQSREHTPAD